MGHSRRETLAFGLVLGACVAAFFHESLFGGKVPEPGGRAAGLGEFSGRGRGGLRAGEPPVDGPGAPVPALAGVQPPDAAQRPAAALEPVCGLRGSSSRQRPECGLRPVSPAGLPRPDARCVRLDRRRPPVRRRAGDVPAGPVVGAGILGPMVRRARLPVLRVPGRLAALSCNVRCDLDAVALPGRRPGVPRPGPRAAGWLAVASSVVVFGGHIQTSAHVLLAGGFYAAWRWLSRRVGDFDRRQVAVAWAAGTVLGLALAAVQIVPLAVYLSRSPVWGDRWREGPPWWIVVRPRVLDAVCTALPYAYGSQRRGHPNLARALGVHNLNESAGGYAGLATLIWLAPLALRSRRRSPRVTFLAVLAAFGAMGALPDPAGRQHPSGLSRAGRDGQPPALALAGLRPDPARGNRDRSSGPDATAGTRLDRTLGPRGRRARYCGLRRRRARAGHPGPGRRPLPACGRIECFGCRRLSSEGRAPGPCGGRVHPAVLRPGGRRADAAGGTRRSRPPARRPRRVGSARRCSG